MTNFIEKNIIDLLGCFETDQIDFEPEILNKKLFKAENFEVEEK